MISFMPCYIAGLWLYYDTLEESGLMLMEVIVLVDELAPVATILLFC